jgi:hypothetical protein
MENLNIHIGVPRYVSTYAAIGFGLSDMVINGGSYGTLGGNFVDVTGNSTFVSDENTNETELNNVQFFFNQYTSFLTSTGRYSLSKVTIGSSSMQLDPIEYGSYYEISLGSNTPISLTFSVTDPNYTYCFYNTSSISRLELSRITFSNMNDINPLNIYFVSTTDINLGYATYAGTFISTAVILSDNTTNKGTVYGSVYGLTKNNTSYPKSINVNFATVCFMEGTKILTDQWYVPVEELNEGDTVMTFGELVDNQCSSDNVPMKILRMQKHVRKASSKTSPIVFTKNVFGVNCPFENLYVSPNHGMIDRKGRRYPAKKFINNTSIFQDPTVDTITYYHVELATHCAVMANGVLTETYSPKKRQF